MKFYTEQEVDEILNKPEPEPEESWIPGTEPGHYFFVVRRTPIVVGVRQLSHNKGVPLEAVEPGMTRIRIEGDYARYLPILGAAGFTRKLQGHISVVTDKAEEVLNLVDAAIALLG